jgi:hypothetical protein
VTNSYGLNIYDLIYHEKLVLTKTAVEEITHLLDPNREKGAVEAGSGLSKRKPKRKPKPSRKRKKKPNRKPKKKKLKPKKRRLKKKQKKKRKKRLKIK